MAWVLTFCQLCSCSLRDVLNSKTYPFEKSANHIKCTACLALLSCHWLPFLCHWTGSQHWQPELAIVMVWLYSIRLDDLEWHCRRKYDANMTPDTLYAQHSDTRMRTHVYLNALTATIMEPPLLNCIGMNLIDNCWFQCWVPLHNKVVLISTTRYLINRVVNVGQSRKYSVGTDWNRSHTNYCHVGWCLPSRLAVQCCVSC